MAQRLDILAESRVRVPDQLALEELRADIMRVAYMTGEFELSRGLRRNYYFDKYAFQTRPAILRRLARFLAQLVPRNTDRLATPALGAVALGTAVSLELGLPLVIVRPDDEPSGARPLEGELYPNEAVTLVEDVVVVGDRALSAVARIRQAGAQVTHVVAVLDRREGAAKRFAEESIEYRPLLTPQDLGIE
jgi:orotate phosphoribosyltransferase